jgi:sugar lactone lactonase YvrE
MNAEAAVLDAPVSTHGEGPVWDEGGGRLFWVDLTAGKLHAWHQATGEVATRVFPEPVCAVAPGPDGRLLVAFAKRIAHVDWASGQVTDSVCEVEPDKPDNRCNDGKSDPAGRFWIGTMSAGGATPGAGSLYRLDGGGRLTRVLDGLTISNGMGWTADARTMFFIDSPTREVWAFDFDPADSSVTNRRTVIRVPDGLGVPDGMCVAPDDTIWVAHWGAGCVGHWDPRTGALLGRIETSCPHTSSCCLTPDGSLFITTSRLGLDEASLAAAPLSGSLLFCSPDHRSAQPASSSAG